MNNNLQGMFVPATIQSDLVRPAVLWSQEYLYSPYEIWVMVSSNMVPGVEDYRYTISNFGNVYDLWEQRPVKPFYEKGGYLKCVLKGYGKSIFVSVHRLVMIAFMPVPNYQDLQVNHLDCVRDSNHATNLQWCTASQNIQYALSNGNMQVGEGHFASKITDEQAHEICRLIQNGMMYKDIAETLNVPFKVVCHIGQRECWVHISKDYYFPKKLATRFTEEEVRFICETFQNIGVTRDIYEYIAEQLGYEYDKKFIRKMDSIRYHENYTSISDEYNIPKLR